MLPGAITLPDGTRVRGRGLRNPTPPGRPDRALYIGSRHRDFTPEWPHDWLDWPDFWLPKNPTQAATLIRALHEHAKSGAEVEVACGGGIGRTGTVIACLATLAGVPPEEAVQWTRQHHHPRAVETPWQRRWVTRFPTL